MLPQGAEVLASGLEGPLIARVRHAGRRFLVVAPDPLQGRWPLSVGFAVFLVNAIDDLSGGGVGGGGGGQCRARRGHCLPHRRGRGRPPRPGGGAKRRTSPSAVPRTAPPRPGGGVAVLPVFERAGWYRADRPAAVAAAFEELAVNLADPGETDLRPPATLELGPGTAAPAVAGGAATVRRSWVPWILAAALGVLLLEWFVYTGRFAPAPAA